MQNDTIEITRKLINGSRNIDRMKDEVNQIVKMIIGLVTGSQRSGKVRFIDSEFHSDTHRWQVRGKVGCEKSWENELIIFCDEKFHGSDNSYTAVFSVDSKSFHGIFVQGVHEALPTLIGGIRSLFPEIEKEWEYLTQASDKS